MSCILKVPGDNPEFYIIHLSLRSYCYSNSSKEYDLNGMILSKNDKYGTSYHNYLQLKCICNLKSKYIFYDYNSLLQKFSSR